MSSCRTRVRLLQSELYNIDFELASLDDKIEDITTYGYSGYIKAVGNSNYNLKYLIDRKVTLQQRKNNTLYKIKEVNKGV